MRRLSIFLIGVFFASATLVIPAEPVMAQKYVPRKVKRKARRLLRKGRRAYRRKHFRRAVKYFLQAFKVWPRRELNYNIAIAYGRLGDKIKAVTYIRRFEKDASVKELRSVPRWLREIKDEVAVVNVQGPDGATVKMDGQVVGVVPVELVIMPGMHLFVIIKDGKRFAKRDWDVKPGLRKVWEVVQPRKVPVRVVTKVVVPVPARQPPPPPPPPPRQGISKWYTITAGLVALGLAGAAIATGLQAKKLHDEYTSGATRELRADGRSMVHTTNILWGVSGGLAVTSVVLAIFTQWKKVSKAEKASMAPRLRLGVGSGGASVSLSGRF